MRLADKVATMARRGAPLPYDAEVEYLESTGTQYIRTGMLISGASELSARFSCSKAGAASKFVFGFFNQGINSIAANCYSDWNLPNANLYVYGNSHGQVGVVNESINEIKFSGKKWIFNGVQIADKSTSSFITSECFLFCGNFDGAPAYYFTGKIYDFAAKTGDQLRDFIPVRVGPRENPVGFMYDRANPTGGPLGNGLYPKSGTGAFAVGPDKT